MEHFVFWRKFRVGVPPPPIAMLKADENVIDELTSMSSSSNQHCIGGRGALAVKGSSLRTGRPLLKCKNHVSQRVLSAIVVCVFAYFLLNHGSQETK